MNRAQLRQFRPGTAEYVVLHAHWSHARGRVPSATLSFEQNPRRALRWAQRFAYFPKNGKYLGGTTPENYVCGECGASGVKLWREYNTCVSDQSLLCLICACREQKKVRTPTEDGRSLYEEDDLLYRTADMEPGSWKYYNLKGGPPGDAVEITTHRSKTDQIGWRVPAIPTEENDTYWGYTSVPQPGCDWWASLPTQPKESILS